MWPFFRKARARKTPDLHGEAPSRRRPMKFEELVADLGDFSDLARHDTALKFWLPEPANEALKEICERAGESMSEMLRRFLAQHCYGVYATEVMNSAVSGIFKDPTPVMLSRSFRDPPEGKVRIDTYWVPELGKNVVPIKVWIPARIRTDLEALAAHAEIKPSQYVREIVISRLLGHGMLPKRPQMLEAAPLPSADDWCEGRDVPMRVATKEECWLHPEGRHTTEWVDEHSTTT
jgi:hypothetical protein